MSITTRGGADAATSPTDPAASAPPTGSAPSASPAGSGRSASPTVTFYDAVGGAPTFRKLVEVFYAGVAADPVLRPVYPEEDLGPAAERLRMFLEQYWGGPHTYSQLRGHPRLRMRHAPFRIGPRERDAWLARMRTAVDSLELSAEHESELWSYLTRAADFMVNSAD